LLLHPAIGATVDEAIMLQGHFIRFATVDLTARTDAIRRQLISFSMRRESKVELEGSASRASNDVAIHN
jgi:5-methylcytosine-specific restriction enzyme subunit McrC